MPTFNNTATLSYNGITVSSNTVTGNILEVLSISKSTSNGSYSSGEEITYVVSLVNTGSSPFTGISINDNLGAYILSGITRYPLTYIDNSVLYYQNGVLQPSPGVNSTQPLSFSNITVPANGNAVIIYRAIVNEFAPLDANSNITNTVTATGTSITTQVNASETLPVEDQPMLTIEKSLFPTTVTENSQITYTFTIRNSGNVPADAQDNIVLSDLFTPPLSTITVELNGVTVDDSNYSYSEATGQFSTAPGFITVPAATFSQDPTTGIVTTQPGEAVLTITGTI